MTIFCPPPGVSRLGVLPFRQCFMLASDDGITPVVACKLSHTHTQKVAEDGILHENLRNIAARALTALWVAEVNTPKPEFVYA